MLLVVLQSLCGSAQFPVASNINSNLRQKTLKVGADSLKIDTISIVPNTFSIVNVLSSDYGLDIVKAMLYWKTKPILDSVIITYRVFPFQLNPVTQRMSFDSVVNNFYVAPFEFNSGLTNA